MFPPPFSTIAPKMNSKVLFKEIVNIQLIIVMMRVKMTVKMMRTVMERVCVLLLLCNRSSIFIYHLILTTHSREIEIQFPCCRKSQIFNHMGES